MIDLDEAFAPKQMPTVFACPEIDNGFHTLTFPCGSHKTFRVRTEKHGPHRGKRSVSLLIGPANTSDYEPFGHLSPDGVVMLKRFANQKQAEYAAILWDLWHDSPIEGCTLEISKRCLICNRELTTTESLAAGIGPSCRERTKGNS